MLDQQGLRAHICIIKITDPIRSKDFILIHCAFYYTAKRR